MSLDSYNSQYPLDYYEIGTAYSFYVHNFNIPHLVEADKKISKKFSPAITSAATENPSNVGSDGKFAALTRAIGVVVEKKDNVITVMFKVARGKYVLNKYAVGTTNVATNENENVLPAPTLS